MSVESIALVLHHSKATGTAKLILLGIANHEGDGGAWPSVGTLCKYAGADVRTVQRALRRLEQLGELETFVQAGGLGDMHDTERPNLYRVLVSCPADCDGTTRHRTKAQQRALLPGWTPSPQPVENPPAPAPGGGADAGGGVALTPGGGVALTPPKPSLEPSENQVVPASPTWPCHCDDESPEPCRQHRPGQWAKWAARQQRTEGTA